MKTLELKLTVVLILDKGQSTASVSTEVLHKLYAQPFAGVQLTHAHIDNEQEMTPMHVQVKGVGRG